MSAAAFTDFLRQTSSPLAEHNDDGSLQMICMDWRRLPGLMSKAGWGLCAEPARLGKHAWIAGE